MDKPLAEHSFEELGDSVVSRLVEVGRQIEGMHNGPNRAALIDLGIALGMVAEMVARLNERAQENGQ